MAHDKKHVPMYPIPTAANEKRFYRYLKEACLKANICPAGRLGLFKYLDMDKAVEAAFAMAPLVENFLRLPPEKRYRKLKEIREH
jgi:UDP-galactopyranose mutase